jgi:hypothetical protein
MNNGLHKIRLEYNLAPSEKPSRYWTSYDQMLASNSELYEPKCNDYIYNASELWNTMKNENYALLK